MSGRHRRAGADALARRALCGAAVSAVVLTVGAAFTLPAAMSMPSVPLPATGWAEAQMFDPTAPEIADAVPTVDPLPMDVAGGKDQAATTTAARPTRRVVAPTSTTPTPTTRPTTTVRRTTSTTRPRPTASVVPRAQRATPAPVAPSRPAARSTARSAPRVVAPAPAPPAPRPAACPSTLAGTSGHVARAGYVLAARFGVPLSKVLGRAGRAGTSDHPAGYALDFMVDTSTGNALAAYVLANQGRLGVTYVIWRQRYNDGSGWDPMADRGGITANHFDHVHVSFSRTSPGLIAC